MTPPPAITPRQMNVLRAVTAMAWADGVLEPTEIEVMASKLAAVFGGAHAVNLEAALRDYCAQNVPLTEVVPLIKEPDDRRLVLKLGYLVIEASNNGQVIPVELTAFQELEKLLGLSAADIHAVSEEAKAELNRDDADPLEALVAGLSRHYN